jgi:predicted NUDIX family NTP pyrophosphohydrolase
VERAAWFSMEEARRNILLSQRPILDALEADLADRAAGERE